MTGPVKLWEKIFAGSYARDVGTLAISTAFAQLLLVALTPVLTRIYTPGDFGVYSIFLSIVAILVSIASLRYELAITLPEDEKTAAELLLISFGCIALTTLVFGGGGVLFSKQIAQLTKSDSLSVYLWFLPFCILGSGLYQALGFWGVRTRAFKVLAGTRIGQNASMGATQTGIGWFHPGASGLFIGDVLGRFVGGVSLGTFLLGRKHRLFRSISFGDLRKTASRYRRFPLLSGTATLLNMAGIFLPPVMMSLFYTPDTVGWLAISQRVIGLPMTIVGGAVAQVYLGEASKLIRLGPEQLRTLFSNTARKLFLFGGSVVMILGLVGGQFFVWIFGESWARAGIYTILLVPMYVAQFVVSPLSQTLIVLERQDLQMMWDIGRLLIMVGSFAGAYALGASDVWAILSFSIGQMLAYVLLQLIYSRAIGHYVPRTPAA